MQVKFRQFAEPDRDAVKSLWERCGLTRPWNDPDKDIDRKLDSSPGAFLVGTLGDDVVVTAMFGYDGHRGWVNYLAVDPALQGQGIGRALMREIEARLVRDGCPKLNVQIRVDNSTAIGFYEQLGYNADQVVSYGKRLIED